MSNKQSKVIKLINDKKNCKTIFSFPSFFFSFKLKISRNHFLSQFNSPQFTPPFYREKTNEGKKSLFNFKDSEINDWIISILELLDTSNFSNYLTSSFVLIISEKCFWSSRQSYLIASKINIQKKFIYMMSK